MRLNFLLLLAAAAVAAPGADAVATADGKLGAATIAAEEETEFVEKKAAVAQLENGAAEKDMSMVVQLLTQGRAAVAGLPATKADVEGLLAKAKVQLTYAAGRVAKAQQEITLEQEGTLKLQQLDAANNGAASMAAKASAEEGQAEMDEAKATKIIADVEKLLRETMGELADSVGTAADGAKKAITDAITEAIEKTSASERFVSKAGKKVADSEVDVAEVEKSRVKAEMGAVRPFGSSVLAHMKNGYAHAQQMARRLHENVAKSLPHFKVPLAKTEELHSKHPIVHSSVPLHLRHAGGALPFHHVPYVPSHLKLHHNPLAEHAAVKSEKPTTLKHSLGGKSAFDSIE